LIFIVLQGGVIECHKAIYTDNKLICKEVGRLTFQSQISALCLACESGVKVAYLTLYDAPYYSLKVVGISKADQNNLRVIVEHSLAVDLELEQTRRFCVDKIIQEGSIFSEFNPDHK
jgi:hypothetical protein